MLCAAGKISAGIKSRVGVTAHSIRRRQTLKASIGSAKDDYPKMRKGKRVRLVLFSYTTMCVRGRWGPSRLLGLVRPIEQVI